MENKIMNRLGNEYMQMTNTHFMGAGLDQKVSKESLQKIQDDMLKEQALYVEHLMAADKDCKPYKDKTLTPVSNRVIVKPYNKNPYRVPMHQANSGLILGGYENGATYKSENTGEVEEAKRGIWCCEVISVGPECKSVQVGEDVYINYTMSAPIPFGDYEYVSIAENNIICRVNG